MQWGIYYDDESRWTSDDGPWESAPPDGVIFVVEKRPEGAAFHSGADYYIRFPDDGSVAATGDLGPLLRRRPAFLSDAIKFGRWTSHSRYERISARAREEWR